MKTPPLLPGETLRRVLLVAKIDGIGVMAVAGLLTLATAAGGDLRATVLGLLATAAGAIELHGAGLLRAGEPRGVQWLSWSQPMLMAVILGVCAWNLTHVDAQSLEQIKTMAREMYGERLTKLIADTGLSEGQYFRLVYQSTYWALAVATLAYQGGMTIYYLRRRETLIAAAEEVEWEEPESPAE